MKKGDLYPLAVLCPPKGIKAQYTGEFRPPLKGEYFLSGAIVEAYKAENNISTPYHIAKLVKVESKTIVINTVLD